MTQYVLVHDIGTSGDKACLYSSDWHAAASVTVAYGTMYPGPNRVEQEPEDWWRAVVLATHTLMEEAGVAARDIVAVSFTGQMMGCVAVDGAGNSLGTAITWADTRASLEAERLSSTVGFERVYEISGHRPSASYSGPKIAWVAANESALYGRAAVFLQAKDFIVARLTGVLATDPSDASGTNLFDLKRGCWSEELVNGVGIDMQKLPDVVRSASVVGGSLREASAVLGLAEGTPVVMGGGDGAVAAVGAGVIEPGEVYVSLGASAWVSRCTRRPLLDRRMQTFTFAGVVDGTFLPTGTMQTAGLSYEWAMRLLEPEERPGREALVAEVLQAASQVVPGAGGLVYMPYLLGERSPHWNPRARGALIGLTMGHTRAHIVRAVLEGVCLNLRTIYDIIVKEQATVPAVWAVGGGTENDLYVRILSGCLGAPVKVPRDAWRSTTLGAAIVGGVGCGLISSWEVARTVRTEDREFSTRDEEVERYEELHDLFLGAYPSVESLFGELATLAAG